MKIRFIYPGKTRFVSLKAIVFAFSGRINHELYKGACGSAEIGEAEHL
jgi:hypothetical protein